MAEQDSSFVDQVLTNLSPSGPGSDPQSSTNQWFNEVDKAYNASILPINPQVNSSVVGNMPTGPGSPFNPTRMGTEDFADGIVNMANTSDQWANNPNSYAQPFSYGAGWRAGNFERYYSSPSFKKLGYFPGRDNEAVYNENTSFMGEFARMVPQMAGLTVDAFADMASEWGSWGLDDPDTSMAEDFQRRMAVGMSSKSGVGGFVTNLGLNLAYPIGIMSEMFAEDLALTAITGLTMGGASEVTLPTMAARTATGFKKLFTSFRDIGKIKEGLQSSFDAVRSIKSVENARDFMKAAKLGKVAEFVNPFESTTKFIRDYDKLKGLGDWAKTSRGAYALYRDARFINAVTGEAKLEAGFRKIEHTDELINDYYDKNGMLPSGDDLKAIEQNAGDAAFAVGLTNMPMIFLTDKIVFDTALKGSKFLRGAEEVGAEELAGYGSKIVIENGKAKAVSSFSGENFKNIFTPKGLAARSMRYVGKNLAQGFQETTQDVIQETFKNYYGQIYKDPTVASMAASLGTGLTSQMTGQGFETFLSGFFMGGAMGVAQGALFNGLMPMGKKIFDPTGYEKWTNAKENYINQFVNTYNDIQTDPKKYYSSLRGLESALVRSKELSRMAEVSGIQDDSVKEVIDAQDEQAFTALIDFIEAGHGNHLKNLIDDFKGKSSEELAKAFGVDPESDNAGTDAKKRLDVFEKRINLATKLWNDSFKEMVNPVDLKKAKQEGNLRKINQWSDFEHYRKLAVFHFYSLRRAMDRQESIYNKILNDPNMKDIPSSDVSPLLSMTRLVQHLDTLAAEVKILKDVDPAEYKKKQKELSLYQEYRDALKDYLKAFESRAALNLISQEAKLQDELVQKQQAADDIAKESKNKLKSVYKKIVKGLANSANTIMLDKDINSLFSMTHDHLILSLDIKDFANISDVLTNPEVVRELTNRWIPQVTTQISANKYELYKEGLNQFFDKQAIDTLTRELSNMGLVIPEEQLVKLENPLLGPITSFIDLVSNKRVFLNDPKGQKGKEIVDAFMAQFRPPQQEGKAEAQAEPGVGPEVSTKPEPIDESGRIKTNVPLAKYPDELKDLRDKLKAGYDKELAKRKADNEPEISEETFLEGPIALNIMDEYYEGKAKQTPPVTKPAPAPAPKPATTPTPALVSTDPKADIERRRQEELSLVRYRERTKDTMVSAKKTFEQEAARINAVRETKGLPKATEKELENIITTVVKDSTSYPPWKEVSINEINAKYDAELAALEAKPTTKPTTKPAADAKADIEKRRQEELKKSEVISGKKGDIVYDIKGQEYTIDSVSKEGRPIKIIDNIFGADSQGEFYTKNPKEINAKYDAELADLETEPTTKPIEKVTLPIDSKYVGKIIYVSPGAGKTTLFEKYSNIIDTDQLLLEKMKQNGMTQEPGESIGQTIYRYFQTNPDRMNRIYAEVLLDMQNLADLGLTVLTGSNRFIPNADHVIITEDDARLEANLKGGMSVDEFRAKEMERLEEPGKAGRSIDYLTTEETLEDKLLRKDPIQKGTFSPIDELNNASNLNELNQAWKEVSQHYTNTNTLIPEEIDNLYQLKLKELTVDLTADNVKVGDKLKVKNNLRSSRKPDIILLFGGNIVEVVSINNRGVNVVKVSSVPEKTKRTIYLTKKQFNELGASLYDSEAADEVIPTPEKTNEEVANKNDLTAEDLKDTSNLINEIRSNIDPEDEPPTADEC